MKRLLFCAILVLGLAQSGYLGAQESQLEEFYLGSISRAPVKLATTPGSVVALGVFVADASGEPSSIIDYAAGQTWYLQIIVVNWATTAKSFKLEFDLRYGDGAGYYVYRQALSIAKQTYAIYKLKVTPYIAKLGIMSIAGRVYGTAMGNDNRVTGQIYVY